MARTLRFLLLLMGWTCVAIGLFHFVLGIDSVPGEGSAGATVDSRERFYGAVFAGYGAAWIYVARHAPISSRAVCWLAGIFFLGGVGRLVSVVVHGWPQWFQTVLTVVELGLPVLFVLLAVAVERNATHGSTPARAVPP